MTKSLYFGPERRRLFGCYHGPLTAADRDLGIVIAAPYGREYLKTHRGLRQLAIRLARAGFHVLRFDYRGCGDSAGDAETADLESWAKDLGFAVEELQNRTGIARIAIVGLRIGGTLALLAARAQRDVEALVLLEPILDGPSYVAELVSSANSWRRLLRIKTPPKLPGEPEDVMGFPLAAPLRRSVESFEVPVPERSDLSLLLIVEGRGEDTAAKLIPFRSRGIRIDWERASLSQCWVDQGNDARALIPEPAVRSILDWLSRKAA